MNLIDDQSTIKEVINKGHFDVDQDFGYRKIRVAVLSSSYEYSNSVLKMYDCPTIDVAAHNPNDQLYRFDYYLIHKSTGITQLADLVDSGQYDIFLNFCDGVPNDDTAGVEVIDYLVERGVVVGGANSKFYNMTKYDMKKLASTYDVPTPAYAFVYDDNGDLTERVETITRDLAFPMIVKHHNGFGSFGMTEGSKVLNKEQLTAEIQRTVREMEGALVEEFVTGREFTVLVAENPYDPSNPTVYEPVECILPSLESFKHFHLKFIDYQHIQWVAVDDVKIAGDLKALAAKMFIVSGGNSYGRCDFRMCRDTGTIYFLEINAQCAIFNPRGAFGSADFILDRCNGHKAFLENMLLCALADYRRANGGGGGGKNGCPLAKPLSGMARLEDKPKKRTFGEETEH